MLPHFSQMGFSYNSVKRSSEDLFPIIPLYNVPKEESLGRRDFWAKNKPILGYVLFSFLGSISPTFC